LVVVRVVQLTYCLLVLVVLVVVVELITPPATAVVSAQPVKETQVAARSDQQHCCFVLVVVVVAKQPLVRTVHQVLVAQVVVDSRFQPDGLPHQPCQQDGLQEAKRSLLVVVVVATPQVAQVAHHLVVAMVVLDRAAQRPRQHPQLVPVVVVEE
jgi:hypothetical protein